MLRLADGLARDAVCSEPISMLSFLLIREFGQRNREVFRDSAIPLLAGHYQHIFV